MERTVDEIEADNLDFGTHHYAPTRPHEGDFCEVSYYLDKNRSTGRLSLFRRRDPLPDPQPLEGGSREEIVEGVRGLKFEYYDGFEWFDEWGDPEGRQRGQTTTDVLATNLSGLPEAVRVTLSIDPTLASKKPANEEKDKAEPPLVFQTIVRLNLAPYYYLNSTSGSTSSSADSGNGPEPQTEGGTQN